MHFNVNLAMMCTVFQIHKVFKPLSLSMSFVFTHVGILSICDTLKYIFFHFALMVYHDFMLVISVSCNFADILWQSLRMKY